MKLIAVAPPAGRAPRGRFRWVIRIWLLLCLAQVLNGENVSARAAEASHKRAIPPLAKVIEIRHLDLETARKLIPVDLLGVVTDLSGYKNSFFFHDATGGISVDRTDNADVHVGDCVRIHGTSGPGLFAPVVLASAVEVLGQGQMPSARRVSYGDMFGGALDSEWVEMQGIVHSAQISQVDGHNVLALHLEIGGGSVNVMIQEFGGIDYERLVDALVRLRGVTGTDFNQKRQFVGLELYVPSQQYLEIVEPANPDPFAVASTPVANALQFGQAQHRVKVTGISTYQISGRAIYIQDGHDGIRIQSKSIPFIGPGRRIEAVGFPMVGDYAPILQDAFIHDLGPVAPVTPEAIEAGSVITTIGDFAQVPNDQQLVQLQGTVEETHVVAGQRIWLLRDGNEVFEAHLSLSATHGMPDIGSGSIVRVVGICTVHADADHNPISFGLLLRGPEDLVILRRASWWTSVHTLVVLGVLAGGMVFVMLWVVVLKDRVEKQTRIIRESEERFRDLAQHDFLTGLPNRLMLEEHIAVCLRACREGDAKAVVFTIDIDRFKRINDTYGHLIGDECLKIVATRLRGIVRKDDVISRTGGEEFTVVVGGLPNAETARRISSGILDLFAEKVLLQGHSVDLTVSVGGAIYPDDSEDSVVLRRYSDMALYDAKNTGRNRAVFYSDGIADANGEIQHSLAASFSA